MTEQTASRTLVKSPPELWAEVSDPGSLARHLGEFGEIRITRLEGESTVAWEGERASGTVEIAPSGWGTKVTLTAVAEGAAAELEEATPEAAAAEAAAAEAPAAEAAEAEAAEAEAPAEPAEERRGFFARLRARWRRPAADAAKPDPFAGVAEHAAAEREAAQPEAAADPEAAAADPGAAAAEPEAAPQLEAAEPAPPDTLAVLTAALDSLGQAHHRPFSRG